MPQPEQDAKGRCILDATEALQHRSRNREGLLRAAVWHADERERSRWTDLASGRMTSDLDTEEVGLALLTLVDGGRP